MSQTPKPTAPASIASAPQSPAPRSAVAYLSDQLERAFRGGAWHGPAVLETLDGLDAAGAARRPLAGAHTIWELVGHTAAWIEVARDRILGQATGNLPPEEDWPVMGAVSKQAWGELLERLDRAHRELRATLDSLDDEQLDRGAAGSDPTVRGLIFGLLQHNVYHAGQIALLRRAGESGGGPR